MCLEPKTPTLLTPCLDKKPKKHHPAFITRLLSPLIIYIVANRNTTGLQCMQARCQRYCTCCQNSPNERPDIWPRRMPGGFGAWEFWQNHPDNNIRLVWLLCCFKRGPPLTKARPSALIFSSLRHVHPPLLQKTKMNLEISSRQVASHADLTLLPSGLPPFIPQLTPLLHPPPPPNWKPVLLESPRWTWTANQPHQPLSWHTHTPPGRPANVCHPLNCLWRLRPQKRRKRICVELTTVVELQLHITTAASAISSLAYSNKWMMEKQN